MADKMPDRAASTAAEIGELGRDSLHATGRVGHKAVADEFVGRVLDRLGRVFQTACYVAITSCAAATPLPRATS